MSQPENLHWLISYRPGPHPEVFRGETRAKICKQLGSAIAENRLNAVMKAVQADPSLVFELIPLPVGDQFREMPFVMACMDLHLQAGYLFAISHGWNIHDPVSGDRSLLDLAVSRNQHADVALLLAMGAKPGNEWNPAERVAPDLLQAALTRELGDWKAGSLHRSPIADLLLDSGARVTNQADTMDVIFRCQAWESDAGAAALTRLLNRLTRAGLDVSFQGGLARQTPLMSAIASKKFRMVEALVHLGADVSPVALNGKDLIELLEKQGDPSLTARIKSVLMKKSITAALAAGGAEANSSEPQSPPPVVNPTRRRTAVRI